MLRRLAAGLFLASCGLVIAVLLVELGLLGLRVRRRQLAVGALERNPFEAARHVNDAFADSVWEVRGERYRPGARLAFDVAGERYEIEINSRGYRTPEFAVPKPDGGAVDPSQVVVQYNDGSSSRNLVQVTDASKCGSVQDAWYYDDNTSPSKIIFCASTCTQVGGSTGQIDVLLGCKAPPPR